MNKIITVLGPTAVGKTDIAIDLARKFNGEIISADSRQIYRGMDIGTGKVTENELKGIPYHLIDILNPGDTYSASEFKKDAESLIKDISSRGKIPIIEGGTGFYISSITEGTSFPEIEANKELRKELEKKNKEELFEILQEANPERAKGIDRNNKVRLIRAIEVNKALGEIPKIVSYPKYNVLKIGVDLDGKALRERINQRIDKRLKEGMIEEVQKLLDQVGKDWLEKIGLEYRYITRFLNKEITREEMMEKLRNKIWQYAKRQRTWFRKEKDIYWFNPINKEEINNLVKNFL